MGSDLSAAIASAAKGQLTPLGFLRKGQSRVWLADQGWWLVVVEFQPSASGRFYVNVGEHHLFVRRDHFVFENPQRPLGSTWTGGAESVELGVASAAKAAAIARERHGAGRAALTRLASGSDDLVAGIANALLGQRASAERRLTGLVQAAYQPVAEEYLRGLETGNVEAVACAMTNETREALKLPATTNFWTRDDCC